MILYWSTSTDTNFSTVPYRICSAKKVCHSWVHIYVRTYNLCHVPYTIPKYEVNLRRMYRYGDLSSYLHKYSEKFMSSFNKGNLN